MTELIEQRSSRTWNRTLLRGAAAAFALGLTFCASVVASPTPHLQAAAKATAKPQHHWFQIGKASWYGTQFQGRKTATGERFDMNALTCAHRTLPLGSWIRVTNLRNKKFEFVRVNDRGPEPADRVIDLSYAAARRIGIRGLGRVKIEEVKPNDPQLAEALIAQLPGPADPAILRR